MCKRAAAVARQEICCSDDQSRQNTAEQAAELASSTVNVQYLPRLTIYGCEAVPACSTHASLVFPLLFEEISRVLECLSPCQVCECAARQDQLRADGPLLLALVRPNLAIVSNDRQENDAPQKMRQYLSWHRAYHIARSARVVFSASAVAFGDARHVSTPDTVTSLAECARHAAHMPSTFKVVCCQHKATAR
jgi:hypothetical protein